MAFVRDRLGHPYAMNTRESFRKQALHYFVLAGIALRNPDNPELATNDRRNHYALRAETVTLLQHYGSESWPEQLRRFQTMRPALTDRSRKVADSYRLSLALDSGDVITLAPGPHNVLQAAIVREFRPRFAAAARLLYLGDAENKTLVYLQSELEGLGISLSSHDKLPDIVLHDPGNRRVFLIEAVYSTGPVSPKRFLELEEVFEQTGLTRVYVTAFPNFTTFKKYATIIAWETEVWLAEAPDHLIHFDGEKFLRSLAEG